MVLTPGDGSEREFDAQQPFANRRLAVPVQPVAFMRSGVLSWARLPYITFVALAQVVMFAWQGAQLMRRCDLQILLVGHLYLAPVGRVLTWLLGRRYVVLLHGGELHRYWHWPPVRMAMVWGMNGAAFLIANSRHTQQQARQRGVQESVPVQIVAPGVDAARFAGGLDTSSTQAQAVQANGAHRADDGAERGPVLLSVARLVEWKGQDTVLRALPPICRAFPGLRYWVAGSGPYRGELEQLAASLGVERNVYFAGFVPDGELAQLYAASDIVVLPSREIQPGVPVEGFGITLMEAAAAGKPVVAGNLGGTQDAVIDGVTGLLVDPTDVHAVADAILRLLRHPDEAARMGAAGQARAAQFDWPRQAARVRQLLETSSLPRITRISRSQN
jgi:phosphatidylinositol alpha-1,6-mannosyltransferase